MHIFCFKKFRWNEFFHSFVLALCFRSVNLWHEIHHCTRFQLVYLASSTHKCREDQCIYIILVIYTFTFYRSMRIRKYRFQMVVGNRELLKKYKNKYGASSHFKSCSISTADFPLESDDILISLRKIYYPVRRVIQRSILLLRMGTGLSKVLAMAPCILRNLLYYMRFDSDGWSVYIFIIYLWS